MGKVFEDDIDAAFNYVETKIEVKADTIMKRVFTKMISFMIMISPVKTGSYVRSHRVISGRFTSTKPTYLGQAQAGGQWEGKWARIGGPHAQRAKSIALANEIKKIKSLKFNRPAKIVNAIEWANDVEFTWRHAIYKRTYLKGKIYLKELLSKANRGNLK